MAVQDQIPTGSIGSIQLCERTAAVGDAGPAVGVATVPAAISRIAELFPDRQALRAQGRSMTYGQLDELTGKIAGRIAAAVAPGAVVAVACPDRLDQVVRLIAVWRAGAIYLALDPATPAERAAFLLADTAVALTLTGQDDELPSGAGPVASCSPEQLAYLVHTSGTTGVPKAVAVAHGVLAAHVAAISHRFDLRDDDAVLHFARPMVDVAIEQVAATLATGACLVLPPANLLSAEEFLRLLDAEQVTVANVAAGYFSDLVAALRTGRPVPAALRTMISGSDRLFPAAATDWHKLTGVRLLNAYGPTETVITATVYTATGEQQDTVPIGSPVGERYAYLL
ncbi:AMP-binding protein, partial [Jatrophihabitans sp.]|uniref:AMP-binding protein n=1 Tax=Jatrophihabitans sp. TaxID=1932789 RepID=UPI002F02E886